MGEPDGGGPTFDELFEEQFPRLVRVARWIVGDAGLAREVVQESFARALARWPRVSTYERPDAWLLTVTVRQAVRVRGRRRREVSHPDAGEVAGGDDVAAVAARLVVREAVAQLAPRQRAAVVLHYLEGLPVGEVAERLGVSEGTVKTHLSRARARIAAALEPDRSDPPDRPDHATKVRP